MSKKFWFPLLAGAALTLGTVAVQAGKDLKVGYLPVTGHAKFFIAKEQGLFAKEGLDTHADNLPDNDNWHTDVTFIETLPLGAILSAQRIPPSAGLQKNS